MNLALGMSKRQILLLAFILIALIATALFVIHTTLPNFWHGITLDPDIMNGWH